MEDDIARRRVPVRLEQLEVERQLFVVHHVAAATACPEVGDGPLDALLDGRRVGLRLVEAAVMVRHYHSKRRRVRGRVAFERPVLHPRCTARSSESSSGISSPPACNGTTWSTVGPIARLPSSSGSIG